MGKPTQALEVIAAKKNPLQTTVVVILQRPMELKEGQAEGVSWEAPRVEAKEQLERWFSKLLTPLLCLPLTFH